MERSVQRYSFRLNWRGQTFVSSGRILEGEEELKLQVWLRSPEHPTIILEVVDGRDRDDLWGRLHLVAGYRGIDVLGFRLEGSLDTWAPLPNGPTPVTLPSPKGLLPTKD
jgi:hypothetical protein